MLELKYNFTGKKNPNPALIGNLSFKNNNKKKGTKI